MISYLTCLIFVLFPLSPPTQGEAPNKQGRPVDAKIGDNRQISLSNIRKVWLNTQSLPSGLGTENWSIISKQLFDSTYQRSQEIITAKQNPPWLTQARYKAVYRDGQLQGTADLTLYNPHGVPAVAKLSPWNLPLIQNNKQAGAGLIYGHSERTLGISVAAKSTISQELSWSLVADQRSDGGWFHFQLPACLLTTIDLVLPSDEELDCPSAPLFVTGPFPVDGSASRRWQLQFGFSSVRDFQIVVRRSPLSSVVNAGLQQSATQAHLNAEFVATSKLCQARYDFDIYQPYGRLSTLTFELPDRFHFERATLRQGDQERLLEWKMTGLDESNENSKVPFSSFLSSSIPHFSFNPFFILSAVEAPNRDERTVQITLPSSVKHRAVLVLSGNFELSTANRFSFSFPRPRGVSLLSPLLRIASAASRSWQDFAWGDFEPVQILASGQQTVNAARDEKNPTRERVPLLADASGFEILVSLHNIPAGSLLRVPSARLSENVTEDLVTQNCWWYLDGAKSFLSVKCQRRIPSKDNVLSWRVPLGWTVKDVLGLAGCELYGWTCQKDLLYVEPKVPAQSGQTITLLIKLGAEETVTRRKHFAADAETRVLLFPTLVPISATEHSPVLSGSYVLTLGRRGHLFPDSVHVLASPGTPSFPDNTWHELSHVMGENVTATPDGFWVFSGTSSAGELSLSSWSAVMFVRSVATVFRKIENGPEWKVGFHLTIDPLAGAVQEIPVHFSQSISAEHLILTKKNLQRLPCATFSLEAGSLQKGVIHFSQPIWTRQELYLELVCSPETSVPLLIPDCNFESTLTTSSTWQITNPNQFGLYQQCEPRKPTYAGEGKSYHYTSRSRSPIFEYVAPTRLALSQCQGHVHHNIVEYEYTASLAPHGAPITLTLPGGAQLLQAEYFAARAKRFDHVGAKLDDDSDRDEAEPQRYELQPLSVEPQVSFRFHPSSEEILCRLVYRAKMAGHLGVSQLTIADPIWDLSVSGQPIQKRSIWCDHTRSLLGLLQAPCWLLSGDNLWLIDSDLIHFVGFSWCIMLVLVSYKFSTKTLYLLASLVLAGALILPASFLLGTTWLIFGLILSIFFRFTKKDTRPQSESASAKKTPALLLFCFAFCLLLFLSSHLFAGPQTVEQERSALVYFLPGSPNDEEHARAAIPAALWSRLQLAASQSPAGFSERYCIESVGTQANVVDESHLSLTTEWTLFTIGVEPLPLVVSHAMTNGQVPREMSLDGQPFQLSLLPGPSGASVGELHLAGAGRHRLRMTWEAPIIASPGMRNIELYFPGAPIQELTVTFPSLPQQINLTGSEGGRTIVHDTARTQVFGNVGLSRKVMISWPDSTPARADVRVDLGVLWQHRIDQSIAHTVLDYHIRQGAIQEVPISLPVGCYIRKIELIPGADGEGKTDGKQLAASSPTQQALRVKSWRIDSDQKPQRLTVELQRPFSGVFHLLLELGLDRKLPGEENASRHAKPTDVIAPLSVPWPIDVTSCRGFVACLFNGVKGDLSQKMPRAPAGSVDFARPWLPVLGLLRSEQIFALPHGGHSSSDIHLHSLSRDYFVAGTCEMSLGEREIVSTLNLQVKPQETPLLYLSADLPSGHHLAEVQGQRLGRWQIMPSGSNQTEKLEIWLRDPLSIGESTELRLISRTPISLQPNATMTVPILQARWNCEGQEPTTLVLKSTRPVGLDNLQLSAGISKVFGPWQNQAILNQCLLDASTLKKSISFEPRLMTRLPTTHAEIIETGSGSQWRLKLQASEDQSLPPWLEIISTTEESLSRMIFQADVPIASRPFFGPDRKLHWSIQAPSPWKRLTITKSLAPDESGVLTLPVLVFPQFPQLKYQQPVNK